MASKSFNNVDNFLDDCSVDKNYCYILTKVEIVSNNKTETFYTNVTFNCNNIFDFFKISLDNLKNVSQYEIFRTDELEVNYIKEQYLVINNQDTIIKIYKP